MLVMQNNIYIISGTKNHCIYDLNSSKIYAIDDEYLSYIESLIKDENNSVSKDVRKFLVDAGILTEADKLVDRIEQFTYEGKVNFVWIEITQNCNLMCRHCYEGATRTEKKAEMSFENYGFIIDFLVKLGVKRIQLVGGEPLVHSKIVEFIKYAIGKFDFIEIYTNGTLLNEELLDLIENNKINLAFSIYSDKKEIHDFVTQTKGSYDITSERIKQVMKRKINFRTASVEMRDVPRYIYPADVGIHRSDLPRLSGRADLSLYTRDMIKRKLITQKTFAKPLDAKFFMQSRVVHNCFSEKFYIDCELNVYPCVMERRFSYGNLRELDFDIMNSDIPYMNKDHVSGCKNCEYRYACYDCRPDAMSDDIYTKPWYCTYDEKEGKWIDEDKFIDLLIKDNNHQL